MNDYNFDDNWLEQEQLEDEEYLKSPQFVIDNIINGNKTFAAIELYRMPKDELLDVFSLAREQGLENEIRKLIEYTKTNAFQRDLKQQEEREEDSALYDYFSKINEQNHKTMKITESKLRSLIKESLKQMLSEQIGSLDDLELYSENCLDLVQHLDWLANALVKKVKRGVEPDFDYLTDSSVMRKIQQLAVIKYSKEVQPIFLSNEEKREFRKYFAQYVLDRVEEKMQF